MTDKTEEQREPTAVEAATEMMRIRTTELRTAEASFDAVNRQFKAADAELVDRLQAYKDAQAALLKAASAP